HRRIEGLPGLRNTVEQSGIKGFLRAEHTAGYADIIGESSDPARLHQRPVPVAAKSAGRFRHLQPRIDFSNDEVAIKRQTEAKPQYIAVQGGNHRLVVDGMREQLEKRMANTHLVPGLLELFPARHLALGDTGTAAEGLALARQNSDIRTIV